MLYYFLLIFNLFIDSCYCTHGIVQCAANALSKPVAITGVV